MFALFSLYLLILPFKVENSVYLFNTHDSSSVEFYDCITDTDLPYCRRPSGSINLQRDQTIWHCDHDGKSHSFESLILNNISVSTVLHQWKSSIEKAEEYSRYRKQRQSNEGNKMYLCECKLPQSFGKHCEYLLPMGITFQQTISWEVEMRRNNTWDYQMYSDIICYTTLICDSGMLCLDWRDICDGVQHCMYGYDEENCDKLEFNECEDNEYRCVNGMCIPDEYFLDGEYDCADLTDEKEPFNDAECSNQPASYECDDRICFRYYWSCGDGQCVQNRLDFLLVGEFDRCNSIRDQYHMCEINPNWARWTLPNGKCYESPDYKEPVINNRTDLEECLYIMKCLISRNGEKNCPCQIDAYCENQIGVLCPSIVQYPLGAIIAPYAFNYYNITRDWDDEIPDGFIINGTIKCRGYMTYQDTILDFSPGFHLNRLEAILCESELNVSVDDNVGYDEFCYNSSQTFDNRSYHFIDICNKSKECISAYRINDGYRDCFDKEDDRGSDQFPNSCSNIRRHRFRCSDEQPTCLHISKLGDKIFNCRNDRDERRMGRGIILSELGCNATLKDGCEFFRQYVAASGRIDETNTFLSDQQLELPKIPFRAFCDSFWNWIPKRDEDIEMCHQWWKCSENQWQCRSGQCIEIEWVLDGEWDCVDASDEQALFIPANNFFSRNLNVIDIENLTEKFNILYHEQPFWDICNLTMEYPCFQANVSNPLNIAQNRPCINLHQIGDGQVDCAGGLDERNNLKHCRLSTMLGYYFQCSSAATCISYSSHCPAKCDDNHVQCYGHDSSFIGWRENDFICLNGEQILYTSCNKRLECSHGEDELFCLKRKDSINEIYRKEKEISLRIIKQKLQLPRFPIDAYGNKVLDTTVSIVQSEPIVTDFSDEINSSISYYCNRGIGVQLYNESIVCFCPPQYYGEKCQFHNDRITFLFHLSLSQSAYIESNNPKTILKLLFIFLNDNQPLMTQSFQIQISDELTFPRKKFLDFLYSRSNISLQHKRARYFNRSNIINEHPYSVRIEAYELNPSVKPRLVGVWLYPIYFDFLPSFRLAKILHLTKPDTTINNPCFSNPCNPQQDCHQILNQNSTYVCLCQPNFKGSHCSIIEEKCEKGFCSPNALCMPTYRGLLSDNERPYCICPLNEMGHQCDLIHDQCQPNPCQNNGTCFSTFSPNQFICLCNDDHYGELCQLEKRKVQLYIKKSPSHRAVVIQYFDINFISLDLLLIHQRVYINLPDLLRYVYNEKIAPAIIIVKLYSNIQSEIYLISIQINVESINGTTELSQINHCPHVETLFQTKKEISPYKYHDLCNENLNLLCFMDDLYLCICEENHNRTECFGYDHNLDQCSFCLFGGQCLKENRLKSNFICLCQQCRYGDLCQFSIEGIGFTLDSLVIQINRSFQIIYFVFALLIFLIGGVTNYANIVTFKRSNLQKTSMSVYMLILSSISQYSLFSLIMKIILILFDSLINDLSCKILSSMHSISIRCSFWLTSLIAIERVSYVLFPYSTLLKKPRVATIITLSTLLIVGGMHVHEFVFYKKIIDQNGHSACVVDFPLKLRTYDRITVLLHYLIPFSIQILSITILIILAARSRSRTSNNHDPFIEYVKQQFKRQKDLYIPPSIIILSGLPQMILSFSFACLELVTWQQHTLLIAYFLSFAPQLLGFVLYVLPSSNYIKEFEATKLSKTIIFRWIISKKKKQTKK